MGSYKLGTVCANLPCDNGSKVLVGFVAVGGFDRPVNVRPTQYRLQVSKGSSFPSRCPAVKSLEDFL